MMMILKSSIFKAHRFLRKGSQLLTSRDEANFLKSYKLARTFHFIGNGYNIKSMLIYLEKIRT